MKIIITLFCQKLQNCPKTKILFVKMGIGKQFTKKTFQLILWLLYCYCTFYPDIKAGWSPYRVVPLRKLVIGLSLKYFPLFSVDYLLQLIMALSAITCFVTNTINATISLLELLKPRHHIVIFLHFILSDHFVQVIV